MIKNWDKRSAQTQQALWVLCRGWAMSSAQPRHWEAADPPRDTRHLGRPWDKALRGLRLLFSGVGLCQCQESAGFGQDSDLQGPSRKCLVPEAEIRVAGGRCPPSVCLPAGGHGCDVSSTPALLKLLPTSLHRSKLLLPSLYSGCSKGVSRAAGKMEPLLPHQGF